jgi:putative heme-binding domain-containing protein
MSSTSAPEQPTATSSRLSPLSLITVLLASAALIAASAVGIRWLTIALTILGLIAGLLGILGYRGRNNRPSRISSTAGTLLNASVLLLTLLAPTLLNPFWIAHSASVDLNALVVVSRTKSRDPGKPLTADEWVNSVQDGIRQGDLFIQLQSVKSDRLPDRGTGTFLLVNLRIDQLHDGQAIRTERFGKGGHEPKLTDDTGREYAFLGDRARRLPSKFDRLFMLDQFLVFELPGKVQYLNLTLPASAWGRTGLCRFRIPEIVHEPPPDTAKQIADLKSLLRRPPQMPPERALGRTLFAKNCQECHTFFGVGGKTGPDLTASKRNDVDFLLTSIIDPSAVIEKKYQATFITTASGVVYNGIIQKEDAQSITILVPSKLIVVPRDEIESMRASNISIMPPELLREFTDHEKRSLIAYLMGASQVPMLATSGNVPYYFPPTQDLSNWHADGPRWTIDKGVIVAPAPAGGKSPLLINDMIIADDFSATFRVNPGKDGRGTIIIGDAGQTDFSNAIRIEFAVGELISIGGVGTKSSPVDKAEKLKAEWNKLEIFVAGKNITAKLNDSDVASATGITPPDCRVIALEVPNVPNRDVRFRPLEMRLVGQK